MEVIWQREAGDVAETALRLIMHDEGFIMFQCRSLDLPEWTEVDEVFNPSSPSETRPVA
jgi:hypothetical protein